MRLAKFARGVETTPNVGLVEGEHLRPLATGATALSDLLHSGDVPAAVRALAARSHERIELASVRLLAPLDGQEVWGAGVTYERSKVARQEESEQGGSFYDLVYRA